LDKNKFFREATLRICGNLEIEEALQKLLKYLKNTMPVSEVFLQYFDKDYNALRSIASATESESHKLDLLSPLSGKTGMIAGSDLPDQDAVLLENPEMFPVTREMGKLYDQQAPSVIIVFLRTL
jgi:hypothetical protein